MPKEKYFKDVDPKKSFPKMEEEILKLWKEKKIFEKSLEKNKNHETFVFFEGPPTANGKPGIHHVLARAFKDIIPRFKTMQGFNVPRKAGWDTHGLPVELEVEKKLEISGKPEIEKYGVEAFNKKCKESVWEYKGEWEKLTKRMAFWLDLDNPYVTYDNKYIESLWWIIKQVYDKGLLYLGHKVVPHCPRCGTALSSHEVAQGYKDVTEPSVYLKFKVKGEDNTYVLSWTTTPWTLPGNVALAVGHDIDYVKVKVGDEKYILAKSRLEIIDEEYEILEEMKGQDLEGIEYEPLFDSLVDAKEKKHYVTTANFVTTDDGTGVVHTAVMYGEDDYQLGEEKNLPHIHTVDENGNFNERVKGFEGRFVKDVEKEIADLLKKKGLLLKKENYTHSYPFCWRCDTPLLYYAKASWFIKMSDEKIKEKLKENNEQINWVPGHIKKGRFGMWLEGVKDWAISRERYWGTPLPIWKCESCGEIECVGSREELKEKATGEVDIENLDLHRPYIDRIKLKCACGSEMTRDVSVLDCWFDSGAMPFSQHHYPFENEDLIDSKKQYPADYISEAIDQTRGWFYTLLAVSTLLDKGTSYKNVICLGHINDKHGKKMSKSKGNVISPWEIFDNFGVDACRFYMYTINAPGEPKRFDPSGVDEVVKNVLLKLWNTYYFFVTYANIDCFKPSENFTKKKHLLDRWVVSKLEEVKRTVTKKLETYDIYEACKTLEKFIEELSNWYVRRSRRRFWKSENDEDKKDAYDTLYYVLVETTKLLAPFTPFIADEIHNGLMRNEESVHLESFPKPQSVLIDEKLNQEMDLAQKIVTLGHAARDKKQIKVRQPLQEVMISGGKLPKEELQEIIKEELNVKELKEIESISDIAVLTLKLKFNILGKKYGQKVKEIQRAVAAKRYLENEDGTLKVGEIVLKKEEYERTFESKDKRHAIGSERDLVLILDTEISDKLKREGLAREFIRLDQDLRKEAGYRVEDRITTCSGIRNDFLRDALKENSPHIKKETLSNELILIGPDEDENLELDVKKDFKIGEFDGWIGVKKEK